MQGEAPPRAPVRVIACPRLAVAGPVRLRVEAVCSGPVMMFSVGFVPYGLGEVMANSTLPSGVSVTPSEASQSEPKL